MVDVADDSVEIKVSGEVPEGPLFCFPGFGREYKICFYRNPPYVRRVKK